MTQPNGDTRTHQYNQEIEALIRDAFEENYEHVRLEGGALAPAAKEAALQQVLFYWRRLAHIAECVTDTEVKLTLPNQRSPEGRPFTIHGVVDIVQDDHQTLMYDIKTHQVDYVRGHPAQYEQQLNVYAHIWQELRGQPLDATAIIATDLPPGLKNALNFGDPRFIAAELAAWDPVVPIAFDPDGVRTTIADFGRIVDAIETGNFAPRPVDVLSEHMPNSRKLFATEICAECDARFSCATYRDYATRGRTRSDQEFNRHYNHFADNDGQEEWRTAGLDAAGDTRTFE